MDNLTETETNVAATHPSVTKDDDRLNGIVIENLFRPAPHLRPSAGTAKDRVV